MDQHMKDTFCKLIDVELDKISKMPALNDATLQNLWRLTDTKKNILKIEKLEKENEMGGNSYGYDYRMDNGYSRRYPVYNDSYGNSYTGYSRDQGGDTYMHLEEAMRHATTEGEREAIRQVMSKYYR